jgi:hypothetical protein
MGSDASASLRRWNRRSLRLPAVVLLALPLIVGWHWARAGWRDIHYNYPNRPSGYNQIVSTFGQPCNDRAHAIRADWPAADNGVVYRIWFHRKLGGRGTAMVQDQDGFSTNLDNDVYGHIQNEHLQPYMKSGIWGYNCRYIRDTTVWSTHAWGIAIDVSSAFEPEGSSSSSTNYHHAQIWRDHRWYWGIAFNDPMHFQFADSY